MKTSLFFVLLLPLVAAADDVQFTEPTEYVNGQAIFDFDKPLRFRVHFGFDGLTDNNVVIEHGSPITFEEIGIEPGESVLGVTVLTQTGKESAMSNVITVQIGGTPKSITDLQ